MPSPAIQDFNQKFGQSAELRHSISQVESLPQLVALLKQWECALSGPELMSLAQAAYQRWINALDPSLRPFFLEAHDNPVLNQAIETCHSPEDAIALAKTHGFQLSEAELREAAMVAFQIEGFSFEKLWFKGIGL